MEKGVDIPNPSTLDIGDEVRVDRISGEGVRIFPGCRIYGGETVVSAGCVLGREAPVTVDDCRLGPGVELKGGYFAKSVFLEKASMGSGAQVREGCILEEEASGAHCVGLKQTILFPFVTLGSLINFCDCLMSGGTSRRDHSEVGSSFIHFNFTPEGDKTTPSLIGDVPRGVMLNRPAIFLGGQGGIVGPIRMGFGNVVAANSVLRSDCLEEGRLIVGKHPSARTIPYVPRAYRGFRRIVENNIVYIANLTALEEWYAHVRRPFFDAKEFGPLLLEGALNILALARKERIGRLKLLAGKAKVSRDGADGAPETAFRNAFFERFPEIEGIFRSAARRGDVEKSRDGFLSAADMKGRAGGAGYREAVQGLPPEVSGAGTAWLQGIVDACRGEAAKILPSFGLFGE
jgi:UDP-N-acetylglucosamine/UDP-N-acetylgalactosamine diphosphorylase